MSLLYYVTYCVILSYAFCYFNLVYHYDIFKGSGNYEDG